MEEFFALGALRVIIVTARITNVDTIAVAIDSERNFISQKIFIAFVATQIFIRKAAGANIGAVVDNGHLIFVEVLFAMFTEAVILVQAMIADMNAFAIAVNDAPSFRAIVLALLAEFVFIILAIVAIETGRNFVSTGNAKAIGACLENLKVISMVLANGNFSVKVRVRPISIPAKAITASNVNIMFVAAVFFGFPKIRDALKLGKFALNKVTIKF